MTTADDLRPWLGPAWDELTPEQRDRLAEESDHIAARYPDPDDADERETALSAAVQYLLGETTADELRERLTSARRQVALALAASKQYAKMTKVDIGRGQSEETVAAAVGIERQTLREYMGLSRNRGRGVA